MKHALILAAVLALTGCSSLKGTFSNRVACTADRQQLVYVSLYGPIGIASKVDAEDGAVVCAPPAASAPK